MIDIDRVAEAICGTTSAGKLFPWSQSTEAEREPWRRMARAALGVLDMTEESAVRLDLQNPDRSIVLTDPADIRSARKGYVGDAEVVDVSRWVTGWEASR